MIPGNILSSARQAHTRPPRQQPRQKVVQQRLAAKALAVMFTIVSLGGWQDTDAQSLRSATSESVLSAKTLNAGAASFGSTPGSGTLGAFSHGKQTGTCPLKHTDVQARIAGYVARVAVKQVFTNPFKEKIEAVYTFPLPENAAVDAMTMKVGTRTISGTIKRREEAREIYEEARAQGHVASLLDQERTNIFTQSVANIMPGETIEITINYVDLLPYEAGSYTFAFPTVVGPRFIPGTASGKSGSGRAPDTDRVHDASRITPPVAPAGQRAGHDISLALDIDAGMPIQDIDSKVHEVSIVRSGKADTAHVTLKDQATIPNKDFVLSWGVAQQDLKSGYLAHKSGSSGYFTMMLMPPKRVKPEQVAPKEMIFLIDCSGSQDGPPLQKAKETLLYIIDHMHDNDSFQILSFNNHVSKLSPQPLMASPAMKSRAKLYINNLRADGGTWMAPAVEEACKLPADEHRLRIVCFMTDGYVGNDYEILGMVRKLRGNSRWFPFGTGDSVNRLLIDGIAREGGGEAEYVLLNSPGPVVGKKFYDRISTPVLTDVKLDFHGLPVKEVFPHDISDVWAERPLYIKGRYLEGCQGTVTITGYAGGKPYRQDLSVDFPKLEPANDVLGPVWARAKVDRLMSEDYFGAQAGSVNKELKDDIIKTALEHHIMTQYTSFVAVEEKKVTTGGKVKTVPVSVELPEGVNRETTIGDEGEADYSTAAPPVSNGTSVVGALRPHRRTRHAGAFSPGYGSGAGGGGGGSVGYALPSMATMPPPSLPPPPLPGASAPVAPEPLRVKPQAKVGTRLQSSPNIWRAEPAQDTSKRAPSKKAESKESALKDAQAKGDHASNDRDDKALSSKLDTVIAGLIGKPASEFQAKGLTVKGDKVQLKLTLTDTKAGTLKQLKALGLEIIKITGTEAIVLAPVHRLPAIAALASVTKITAPPNEVSAPKASKADR